MPNFDEHNIADAVLARLADAPNPRTKDIRQALVRHLHDFVREIEPTQADREQAIDFRTCTGHMCDGVRQEFILLSDALGVSMLVDTINHHLPRGVTETTVFGPFFVAARQEVSRGARIADDEGFYDVQKNPAHLNGRACVRTDADGCFHVFGALPAAYAILDDGMVGGMMAAQGRHPYRPAHAHFMDAPIPALRHDFVLADARSAA